jgi:hypothetical protein
MSLLSLRPRGVRKSWSRVKEATPAVVGAYLGGHPLVDPDWGTPVEAHVFADRAGRWRRVEAVYRNGRVVSYSRRNNGQNVIRFFSLPNGVQS